MSTPTDTEASFQDQLMTALLSESGRAALARAGLRVTIACDDGSAATDEQLAQLLAELPIDDGGRAAGRANSEKAALMVAHEARNALSGVIGLTQQVVAHFDGSDKHRRMLTLVESEAKRCSNLLSEYVHGRRDASFEDTESLSALVDSVVTVLSGPLAEQRVAVEQVHQPQQPDVTMRAAQIRQVLINLVLNSLQAMASGGRLRIETLCDDNYGIVRVHDSGPGVPEALRKRIFTNGFTTKAPSGSGVGLAVSAQIAAEHGGRLRLLDSDDGASFELRLPLRRD